MSRDREEARERPREKKDSMQMKLAILFEIGPSTCQYLFIDAIEIVRMCVLEE